MRFFLTCLEYFAVVALVMACSGSNRNEDAEEILFNGKDLTGWHVSRTSHQGTVPDVMIEEEAIVIKQNPYGQGGVLLSDKKYKNFELWVDVKIDSFCNGGIFLRCTESGQAYQVELSLPGANADLFGERLEIGLPGRAKRIAEVWRPGEWNAFRIRMMGEIPRVTLWVNDTLMWDIQQPKNDFIAGATSGMIGFQSHWSSQYLPTPGGFNMPGAWRPDGAHRFRNIRIKELPIAENTQANP